MNPLIVPLQQSSESAGLNGVVILSGLLGNFAQGQAAVTDGYSAVPHIFSSCNPAAVIRGIARVVVDSVKLMGRGWSWPHVSVERFERILPLFAHGYSSCAVVFKACVGFTSTPCSHRCPSVPLGCSVHPVLSRPFLRPLPSNTTARLCIPVFKAHATHNRWVSALAKAIPTWLSPLVFGTRDNREFSVNIANKVFRFCHLNQSKLVPIL
jgi:hypothetical protein